eukprot:CAMPEP_0117756554 /NCGR_PEP_ID=MMETSP0947-20121206/14152_1 /TAXON_ID=44440 /ORGANISM="Chattonella subsalsa, Strain CCMP2191" /LENGTH=412 /DNA_ID=CAMNT_0005576173 /DNA_START=185 /DNA_END=1423 /DNA_ORIENTATION=+
MFIMGGALFMFYKVTMMMFFGPSKKTLRDILKNPVMVAWYLLLPPNMVMTAVYFMEHAKQLATNSESEAGPLCNFVAFWAISAIVSLNGASITIAYVTYRLVKDGKKPRLRVILIGNGISWLFGLTLATIFMTGDSIGPYQGLYCCVREEAYYGFRVALIFTTFAVSISAQSFFYYSSYSLIKSTEGGALQSSGGSARKASKVIMQRGMEMVGIFYLCWFIIAVDSIVAYSGTKPNIWVSALGAWLAKSNPALHCIMMYRNLKRMNKISATSSTGGASSMEPEEALAHKVEEIHAITQSMEGEIKKAINGLTMKVADLESNLGGQIGGIKNNLEEIERKQGEQLPAIAPVNDISGGFSSKQSEAKLREQILQLQEQNRGLERRLVQAYEKYQIRPSASAEIRPAESFVEEVV